MWWLTSNVWKLRLSRLKHTAETRFKTELGGTCRLLSRVFWVIWCFWFYMWDSTVLIPIIVGLKNILPFVFEFRAVEESNLTLRLLFWLVVPLVMIMWWVMVMTMLLMLTLMVVVDDHCIWFSRLLSIYILLCSPVSFLCLFYLMCNSLPKVEAEVDLRHRTSYAPPCTGFSHPVKSWLNSQLLLNLHFPMSCRIQWQLTSRQWMLCFEYHDWKPHKCCWCH